MQFGITQRTDSDCHGSSSEIQVCIMWVFPSRGAPSPNKEHKNCNLHGLSCSVSAQKAEFCFPKHHLGKLPWFLGYSTGSLRELGEQMRASTWWWHQVQLGTANWEKLKFKKREKDILSLTSSSTVDKKWQNYTGKALGNKFVASWVWAVQQRKDKQGRTAVTMLKNRGSTELQKLLSIEFHTQLLSQESQILFIAILLAECQFSHDLHNFFNPINEIVFPSISFQFYSFLQLSCLSIFFPFQTADFP